MKRLLILMQLYSIDLSIHGQVESLQGVEDHETRERMFAAIECLRSERARLRSEYSALLPVGKRVMWGEA